MIDLWKITMITGKIPGFSDQEIASARRDQSVFLETCRSLASRSSVLKVAQAMGEEMIPKISEGWITYRRIQAWALQALVLLRPNDPNAKPPTDLDLEHDTLDNEYLILALHAGALATMESRDKVGKMGWRFRILRPDGALMNRDGSTNTG